MHKEINNIYSPPPSHMVGDGFKVHNFFPNGYRIYKQMSPFFLMDYNAPHYFPPTDKLRGVGVHPHRGFETVTIAFQGKIAHHDSAGNSGVIGTGDVQWMTAGSGVLHKEYHDKAFSEAGGTFQMVQLWVNLPAANKMTSPKYQGIKNSDMGKLQLPNNNGEVTVIAGKLETAIGPASTFTPINLFIIDLNKAGTFSFDIVESHNCGILQIEGESKINDQTLATNHLMVFENKGRTIDCSSEQGGKLLVLSGEPINEPIAHYGPFLMNKTEELQQAMQDFNAGKFGHLED